MAKVEVGGLLVMPIVMVRQLLAGEERWLLGESKDQEIGPAEENDDAMKNQRLHRVNWRV